MANHTPPLGHNRNLKLRPAPSQSAQFRCSNRIAQHYIHGDYAPLGRGRSAANDNSALDSDATLAADPRQRSTATIETLTDRRVDIDNDHFFGVQIQRQFRRVHHFRKLFGRGDEEHGQTEGANAADESDAIDCRIRWRWIQFAIRMYFVWGFHKVYPPPSTYIHTKT